MKNPIESFQRNPDSNGSGGIDQIHQDNPLLKVQLSGNLTDETLREIETLGINESKTQDAILKKWAEQIREETKKVITSNSLENERRIEIQKKLENLKETAEKMLTQLFSDVMNHDGNWFKGNWEQSLRRGYFDSETKEWIIANKEEFLQKNKGKTVDTWLETQFDEYGSMAFDLYIHSQIERGADWGWIKNGDNSIKNNQRKVTHSMRGNGIAQFMEDITEKAAKETGIKKITFSTTATKDGLTFPLTQGYTCVSLEDRNEAIRRLKKIYDEKNNENVRASDFSANRVLLEKKISD